MSVRNGQTPLRDPSVLREASSADRARTELQNASNPWSGNDQEREYHLRLAAIHSRLAMAESIDLLARVIDGVWQQAAREIVFFRTSRSNPDQGGRAM